MTIIDKISNIIGVPATSVQNAFLRGQRSISNMLYRSDYAGLMRQLDLDENTDIAAIYDLAKQEGFQIGDTSKPSSDSNSDNKGENNSSDKSDDNPPNSDNDNADMPEKSDSQESDQNQEDVPDEQKDTESPGENEELRNDGKGWVIEVRPALLGYYAIARNSKWIPERLVWRSEWDKKLFSTPIFGANKYTMTGKLNGAGIKNLPIPYGYLFNPASLGVSDGPAPKLLIDQNANFFLDHPGQSCDFWIDFYLVDAATYSKFIKTEDPDAEINVIGSAGLTAETTDFLDKQAHSFEGAINVLRYVKGHHEYPAPAQPDGPSETIDVLNEAGKQQARIKADSNAENYFYNLDNTKQLECLSANSLNVAMCRVVKQSARIVTGYHVQNPSAKGVASISAGDGHAWSEVLDEDSTWALFDATPSLPDGTDIGEKNHSGESSEVEQADEQPSVDNDEDSDQNSDEHDITDDIDMNDDDDSNPPDDDSSDLDDSDIDMNDDDDSNPPDDESDIIDDIDINDDEIIIIHPDELELWEEPKKRKSKKK